MNTGTEQPENIWEPGMHQHHVVCYGAVWVVDHFLHLVACFLAVVLCGCGHMSQSFNLFTHHCF